MQSILINLVLLHWGQANWINMDALVSLHNSKYLVQIHGNSTRYVNLYQKLNLCKKYICHFCYIISHAQDHKFFKIYLGICTLTMLFWENFGGVQIY